MSDLYRAHRFGIIKTEDGLYDLFDPAGKHIASGSPDEICALVLTGPEHYELCAERWCAKPKTSDAAAGKALLAQLGLNLPQPTTEPLKRRI